ncbi:hypothetical protein AVEN_146085-1 [Araneus ventricosus]|uniref:Uncharacterized protein n=1 Tax=Araneus ventricosus TaxID=182803 RepID=A0A4Y2GN07_ARAVE|nr:hypothetical protein AVEN_146085-1 [Araneus ventricosus]
MMFLAQILRPPGVSSHETTASNACAEIRHCLYLVRIINQLKPKAFCLYKMLRSNLSSDIDSSYESQWTTGNLFLSKLFDERNSNASALLKPFRQINSYQRGRQTIIKLRKMILGLKETGKI